MILTTTKFFYICSKIRLALFFHIANIFCHLGSLYNRKKETCFELQCHCFEINDSKKKEEMIDSFLPLRRSKKAAQEKLWSFIKPGVTDGH